MSITRLAIRQAIAEETGLGFLATATAAGSTTTFIAADVMLAGPMSAQRFGRGSAVRFSTLGGAASTEGSFVDLYTPSTGTLTLSPAVSTATHDDDVAEIWSSLLLTVDRIDEAIDRALTRHCFHWVPIPLTFVKDGDCGDSGVTLWGTASNATATKVAMPWPGTIGQRYLRVANSGAGGYLPSANIMVQAGDVWPLDVLVYVNVGVATLSVYDNSNAAAITLSGDGGSYSGTGWKRLTNTFTIPSGCKSIAVRCGGVGATADTYWASVIAYPQDTRRFPLPARCAPKRLGYALKRRGEEVEDFYFAEYTTGWSAIQGGGEGLVVQLPTAAGTGDPRYIEELQHYDALATDAATTNCPDELAIKAGIYEVYKGMARDKPTQETKSGYLTASDIKQNALDALRDMKGVQHLLADDRTVYR